MIEFEFSGVGAGLGGGFGLSSLDDDFGGPKTGLGGGFEPGGSSPKRAKLSDEGAVTVSKPQISARGGVEERIALEVEVHVRVTTTGELVVKATVLQRVTYSSTGSINVQSASKALVLGEFHGLS